LNAPALQEASLIAAVPAQNRKSDRITIAPSLAKKTAISSQFIVF